MPSAYVLIICELSYEDQTVNDLNTLAGVDATRLAGAYDIIAKINAESTEILSRIIGLYIKKLDRIQSTLTLIVNEDLQWRVQVIHMKILILAFLSVSHHFHNEKYSYLSIDLLVASVLNVKPTSEPVGLFCYDQHSLLS